MDFLGEEVLDLNLGTVEREHPQNQGELFSIPDLPVHPIKNEEFTTNPEEKFVKVTGSKSEVSLLEDARDVDAGGVLSSQSLNEKLFLDKSTNVSRASSVHQQKIQSSNNCNQSNCSLANEGHVCFDCFPIPDDLLTQLHRQTGMVKLACLQTVQTVIKYYKHDIACAKYFVHDASITNPPPNSFSEFSADSDSFSDSVKPSAELLVKRPTTNITTTTTTTRTSTYSSRRPETARKQIPNKVEMSMGGIDQFRSLIDRLKLTPAGFWTDPKNASYVFSFFRKLNKLVVKLDRSVLKRVLYEDDMNFVWILTRFLRTERRWSIQWEILGVLGTIAARDSRSRKKILDSDFSAYLSRAIVQSNSDPAKLAAYAELLTVLFTGGKPLPVHLLETFGVDFMISLLNMIEEDDSQPGWVLPETFLKLLLAYNLQFSADDVYDNLTIVAITQFRECKTLTSRLVDWMETKDCPLTSSWDVSVSLHQCVIKLATDIFCCQTTSHIFSTPQSLALLRLLIKNLASFPAGDKRRASYLKLIQAILRHCKYHYIRDTPSSESLSNILEETSKLSLRDQDLIRSIFKEFPLLKHETGY